MNDKELQYYYNLQLVMAGVRNDSDDEENEPKSSSVKRGGGRYGLPYGLCKSVNIDVPKGATPSDAWDLLIGKTGINPKEAYNTLKEEGKADKIVDKIKSVSPGGNKKSVKVNIGSEHFPAFLKDKKAGADTISHFVKFVNSNKDAHADATKLYSNFGNVVKRLHDYQSIKSSYATEDLQSGHVSYYAFSGDIVEVKVSKINKTDSGELLKYKVATMCHEYGHVIDMAMGTKLKSFHITSDYKELDDAIKDEGYGISDSLRSKFEDARAKTDELMKPVQKDYEDKVKEYSKKFNEAVKGISYWSMKYDEAENEFKKNKKKALKEYKYEHDRIYGITPSAGVSALEGFFDALSKGKYRDEKVVRFGHSLKYYNDDDGNGKKEMFADYLALKMCYPEEYAILKKEKPKICDAFDGLIGTINDYIEKGTYYEG